MAGPPKWFMRPQAWARFGHIGELSERDAAQEHLGGSKASHPLPFEADADERTMPNQQIGRSPIEGVLCPNERKPISRPLSEED